MENFNGVFVRFPPELLAELDKLVELRNLKNKQFLIIEAVSQYISKQKALLSLPPYSITATPDCPPQSD
jgi:metal-responsive CopG/Arc/MetJ family transcriptional regulator